MSLASAKFGFFCRHWCNPNGSRVRLLGWFGLPLRMSGLEGIQAEKMQIFAEELRKRFKLPVHLWDERLTSAEANRLLRETEISIEKRGKAVDRMAAVLILQGWMERQAR